MANPEFPFREPAALRRRTFIAGSVSLAAAALLSNRAHGAVARARSFSGYPFTLGVASGDPLADGVVLWTRLAPRPLDPDGGMGADPVAVDWEIAEDERLQRIVQRGSVTANVAWTHSVHVEVSGLRPERWYWYRFKAGGEISATGRTRTAPAAATLPSRLRFAFASCQRYENGYYTAYEHLAREDVELVLHLGDYIYEGETRRGDIPSRTFATHDAATLNDYRLRYARYKSDPALQAAHAAAPWIVTWDDHEVSNDYAGDRDEHPDRFPREAFRRRRAGGYQAFYEHQPLRASAVPRGPDALLYRRADFGRLLSFHVLDTRQYRTPQPVGGGMKAPTPALLDPRGTLLGARQRAWLLDGLAHSSAAWNALAQQIQFARVDRAPGADISYSMDKWSGYEFERRQLLRHFREANVPNPVVVTGDIHNHWANELAADPEDPASVSVATEFIGTSITSGGDGGQKTTTSDAMLAENPFVKFFNNERGYVRCEVTPAAWRTDYRTVPYVSRPGAPLQTRATFHVGSGRPRSLRA